MCEFCDHIYRDTDRELPDDRDYIVYDNNSRSYYIAVCMSDSFVWGRVDNVKYCPTCGRKLYCIGCGMNEFLDNTEHTTCTCCETWQRLFQNMKKGDDICG